MQRECFSLFALYVTADDAAAVSDIVCVLAHCTIQNVLRYTMVYNVMCRMISTKELEKKLSLKSKKEKKPPQYWIGE